MSKKLRPLSYPRGFSLIELMIVVSILTILASIAIVNYQNFFKSSRDSKRQSDLRFIQGALEQYHNDQNYYPAAVVGATCTDGTFKVGCPLKKGSKIYLNTIPQDPLPDPPHPQYRYVPSNSRDLAANPPPACDNNTLSTRCVSYCLYAKLESGLVVNTDCPDDPARKLEVAPP